MLGQVLTQNAKNIVDLSPDSSLNDEKPVDSGVVEDRGSFLFSKKEMIGFKLFIKFGGVSRFPRKTCSAATNIAVGRASFITSASIPGGDREF